MVPPPASAVYSPRSPQQLSASSLVTPCITAASRPGWVTGSSRRRSSCESRNWGSGTRGEVFVIAPEGEEVVTDSSLDTQAPGVEVIAEQNPDRVSAREWIDSNLHYGVGSMMGQQYEETVLDGRP